MPVLEAEDELKQPVSDARIYDVVLRATGDEEAAAAALRDRVEARLRKGQTPEI